MIEPSGWVLGIVTDVTVPRVRINGDKTDTPAAAVNDFSGGTDNVSEVLVLNVEGRRFALLVP